jgi:beta-aspartyl-peptidase (threonine type)
MDASLMDGNTGMAGSLCGVKRIRNPIKAAQLIMLQTPHVMLYGEDAEVLSREHGLEIVEPSWFHTDYRWDQLVRAREANALILDHEQVPKLHSENSKGTVGAVACDLHGNVAAATSTGGLVNKRSGRVGDSAIIGAGTYAKNSTCAVSATGHGELFIRSNVAGRLSALIELAGLSLSAAADRIIHTELPKDVGGLIAVDANGNIVLPFNSGGMFRGYLRQGTQPVVKIW